MPDPLAPLFEDMRRRALPRVQPPGPAAARRTVHRRATVRAAALATVVMAAGGTFIISQRGGGDGVAPASVPSASFSAFAEPYVSGMPWRGRPDKADIARGLVPGAQQEGVVDGSQDIGMDVGKGRHLLRVGCSGPAPLPVTILLDDEVDQQDTIACTDAGTAAEYEFTMAREGSLRVVMGSGGQFDAYAFKVTKK
ncbi:hypothetical protein COUCH_17310 [Couchioplanes caeruleus]|uniref:hypothetical protein n=1 Tax=Couchioplanes caeruleus TaxID=56438 RepID=UPI0020C08243|nr:hypothetical protein [Couchioplanes caeruleus]UQU67926.1 hypothetical protein COUCH_17310 [Couchioplanes caeruleus]